MSYGILFSDERTLLKHTDHVGNFSCDFRDLSGKCSMSSHVRMLNNFEYSLQRKKGSTQNRTMLEVNWRGSNWSCLMR